MKCPLCGFEFQEEEAQHACNACPMHGDCNLLRCPNCSYEIPAEPKLIKAIRAWMERQNGIRGKG